MYLLSSEDLISCAPVTFGDTSAAIDIAMLRRVLRWLLYPVWRCIVWVMPDGDPWERIAIAPRLALYGSGLRVDFPRYLTGPSNVVVRSIDDIQDWLLECRYESDDALFGETDFWQHPATFERLRAGDCEDFALWGWRKLVDLGLDAEIVVGYCLKDGQLNGRHAWILFRRNGTDYLFEPSHRPKETMIRPLDDVRQGYLPEGGADSRGRRFGFSGYLSAQKRLLGSRSARRIS